MKLSINLGQLEGGTGSQPLLLRQPIVFVLIMMLLSLAALRHGCSFVGGWSVCTDENGEEAE